MKTDRVKCSIRPILEIRGGESENDIMAWPNPNDPTEIEYALRYVPSTINRTDMLRAASYIHAYRALIAMPYRARNQRISQIRIAMREAESDA